MVRFPGVVAAATLAVATTVLFTPQAATAETGSFIFGGGDVSESGYFAYAGGGFRPNGDIDSSGLLLRGFVGAGSYEYDAGGPTDAQDDLVTLDLMVGGQSVGERTRFAGYIGANFQDHSISDDPFNDMDGDEWGIKGQVEVYSEPSDNTMFLGILSYSSASETYFGLGRAGWRLGDGGVFVGPEIGFSGNERYDGWRAGLHATGFKVGPLGFGGSVGYGDSDGEDGVYGSVGLTLRY